MTQSPHHESHYVRPSSVAKAPRNKTVQTGYANGLEITAQKLRARGRSLRGKVNSVLHGLPLATGQGSLTAKRSYLSEHLHLVEHLYERYSNSISMNTCNIWRSQCEVGISLKKQLIHSIKPL